MNARERMLAIAVLLVVVLLVGGFFFKTMFLSPLAERNESILALRDEISKKQERVHQIEADLPRLERWRVLSLPPDVSKAKQQYGDYLSDLMRDSGFAPGSYTVVRQADSKTAPTIGKIPVYQKFDFTIQAHTSLDNLVAMLDKFYHTGLLQQVKKLSAQRPLTTGPQQLPTDLDVNMTVEAIIITGAEERPNLLPTISRKQLLLDVVTALRGGPTGLALIPFGPGTLARTSEQYAVIGEKNIFFGPSAERLAEEVEVTRFVHLTHITRNERRAEAWLYNRYDNRWTRLRAEAGFDFFRISDEKGNTILKGKVMRIEPREVIFKVDDNYYALHVGQNVETGMKTPLTSEQRKLMGFVSTVDSSPVKKVP